MSRIKIDEKKCSGCLACLVTCLDYNYDHDQEDFISGRIHEKKVSSKSGLVSYKTRSCHHCPDAPCISACPTGALFYTDSGLVKFKQDKCIGCRACARACPHDIPRFTKSNKIFKCHGCEEFLLKNQDPPCVAVCPSDALTIEDF